LSESGAGIKNICFISGFVFEIANFPFDIPGSQQQDIQEFIKEYTANHRSVNDFTESLFYGIVLHE